MLTGALEAFVADYDRRHNGVAIPVGEPTGKQVAVVGAGPAGLACAAELRKRGHDVTVFEAFPVPGGLLVYGIPNQGSLGYYDWKRRRRNEFNTNRLASLTYSNLNIKTITLRRLGFQVTEIMQATTGQSVQIDKEIILEQEKDNEWRVVEENIKHWHRLKNQDDHQ